jgi:hypothetical protein
MTRLILDHYRRWWLVLAFAGALEFGLGLDAAWKPNQPLEFWGFMLALWAGANLLSFDLRRGFLRPVAALPLTARQIGRSWWLATVPIPAIVLAGLLFLGAETFCHFHPDNVLPTEWLAKLSLFTLVWLGMVFPMTVNPTWSFGGGFWKTAGKIFVTWFSMLTLFGTMLLCQEALKSPVKFALLLAAGALLTVMGWVRAEQFDPGQVGPLTGGVKPSALGRGGLGLPSAKSKAATGRYQAPAGCGGIPFLMRASCIRAFLYIASMNVLMALLYFWRLQGMGGEAATLLFATTASFMSCGFVLVFQFLPILRQLRFLRTLPISETRLAALMLVTVGLPIVALGALTAGFAQWALGPVVALGVLNSYVFLLAPTSLSVLFGVWLGEGKLTWGLSFAILFGSQILLASLFRPQQHRFALTGCIAGGCILLAFLLTRLALARGGRVYRVQINPMGGLPWGMNK